MVERKQFKTRLCALYQRGHCARQNCNFAHGNAELRRFSSSYSGRRDYLGNDLRDKLDRRHISPRRYSAARDARGRQTIRENSPPRSPEKKSDRRHRRKQGISVQSDISGSLKVSDRIQDRVKEEKLLSSGSRNSFEDQTKKVSSDIMTLENRKFQLEVYLDESVQEVDTLNSRIQELETQLNKENEECKRTTSRIRKFVRMHNHNAQLQDELKRSQVQLQRFGDQLVSDISRVGANEEDLSVDIVGNGENVGLPSTVKHNLEPSDASPRRKRLHVEQDAVEELKQDKLKVGHLVETARPGRRSRWNLSAQSNDSGYLSLQAPNNVAEVNKPLDLEGKHKKAIWNSSNNTHSEKLKESKIEVPSTSMAAHVFDEEVEVEQDDGIDINKAVNTENDNGVAFQVKAVPFMPPRSNYLPSKDKGEKMDGLDEEAAGAHVDIV